MKAPAWCRPCVALLIFLVGLIPVLIYLWVFGRAASLRADLALGMLNDAYQNALLVDVRPEAEFSEMHVAGSYNWPAAQIASLNSLEHMPADLNGRTLFLLCNSGFQSAQAAQRLNALGVVDVYSLKGGMQTWIGVSHANPSLQFTEIVPAGTSLYRRMSLFEQTAVVVSAFGFKPLHMLLSALLSFILLKQK